MKPVLAPLSLFLAFSVTSQLSYGGWCQDQFIKKASDAALRGNAGVSERIEHPELVALIDQPEIRFVLQQTVEGTTLVQRLLGRPLVGASDGHVLATKVLESAASTSELVNRLHEIQMDYSVFMAAPSAAAEFRSDRLRDLAATHLGLEKNSLLDRYSRNPQIQWATAPLALGTRATLSNSLTALETMKLKENNLSEFLKSARVTLDLMDAEISLSGNKSESLLAGTARLQKMLQEVPAILEDMVDQGRFYFGDGPGNLSLGFGATARMAAIARVSKSYQETLNAYETFARRNP